MARIKTTPLTILARAQARIIAQTAVNGLTASTVYIADNQDWTPPNPGDLFAVLVLTGATFDDTLQDGAGNEQVTSSAQLLLTVHNIQQLDEPGHAEQWLTHATLGTYPLVTKLLKTLSGHDLLDGSGNEILRQPLMAQSWNDPEQASRAKGTLTIAFSCLFDWDLA